LLKTLGDTLDAKFDTSAAKDPAGDPTIHGTELYGQLVGGRAGHILSVLQQKVPVLYVDIDTVWKNDPFRDIDGVADMELTLDHPKTPNPFCTCFIYARPTDASLQAMRLWGERVVGKLTNQATFNEVVKEMEENDQITLKTLQQIKYPHGGLADERYTGNQPTVVHANYMKGVQVKVDWFQHLGLWNPGAIDEPLEA